MPVSDYIARSFLQWIRAEIRSGMKDAIFVLTHLLSAVSALSLFVTFSSPVLVQIMEYYRIASEYFWGFLAGLVEINLPGRSDELLSFIAIIGMIGVRSIILHLPSLPKKDQVLAIGAAPVLIFLAFTAQTDPGKILPSGEYSVLLVLVLVCLAAFALAYPWLSERIIWHSQSALPAGRPDLYHRDGIVTAIVTIVAFITAYFAMAWAWEASLATGWITGIGLVWGALGIVVTAMSLSYVRSTATILLLSALLILADLVMTLQI